MKIEGYKLLKTALRTKLIIVSQHHTSELKSLEEKKASRQARDGKHKQCKQNEPQQRSSEVTTLVE